MRPLRIGIDKDLVQALPEVPKRVVKCMLGHYTKSAAYRTRTSVVGNARIGLDGVERGFVSQGQATRAQERLSAKVTTGPVTPSGPLCIPSGKITYANKAAAVLAGHEIADRQRVSHAGIAAYGCAACGGWHWRS